jgi:hypothetical protein
MLILLETSSNGTSSISLRLSVSLEVKFSAIVYSSCGHDSRFKLQTHAGDGRGTTQKKQLTIVLLLSLRTGL